MRRHLLQIVFSVCNRTYEVEKHTHTQNVKAMRIIVLIIVFIFFVINLGLC